MIATHAIPVSPLVYTKTVVSTKAMTMAASEEIAPPLASSTIMPRPASCSCR